jgi:small ligand-binding sensory domain FIST
VPYAAALSEHPLATHATGEVVGEVLDRLGGRPPDLAVLFVTRPHLGALEDIAAAVRATLAPDVLLAATAVSVLAGREEAEDVAAVSLWAGHTGPVTPVALDARAVDGEVRIDGVADDELAAAGTLLLLADPASFPVDVLLSRLATDHPGLDVVGGMASAGAGPGGNRLVLDGRIRDRGAVGVLLPAHRPVRTVVSQGCAPVGDPYTVTRAEGSMIHEIAGRPALERIREVIDGLDDDQRRMASAGLHLGRVVDEHKVDLDRGDFLVRNVLGADPSTGAVAVGDEVAAGDTVQLQVRDAASADVDLRVLLDPHEAAGALVFTCNGRGERFFGRAHHDAEVVSEALGTTAVAGMFCAGEIGPVGARSHLHGFTACIALFD